MIDLAECLLNNMLVLPLTPERLLLALAYALRPCNETVSYLGVPDAPEGFLVAAPERPRMASSIATPWMQSGSRLDGNWRGLQVSSRSSVFLAWLHTISRGVAGKLSTNALEQRLARELED